MRESVSYWRLGCDYFKLTLADRSLRAQKVQASIKTTVVWSGQAPSGESGNAMTDRSEALRGYGR